MDVKDDPSRYSSLCNIALASTNLDEATKKFLINPDGHFAEVQRCLQHSKALPTPKVTFSDGSWEKQLLDSFNEHGQDCSQKCRCMQTKAGVLELKSV